MNHGLRGAESRRDEEREGHSLHREEPDDGTQVPPPDDEDAGQQQDPRAEGDELGEHDGCHDYPACTTR